MQKVRFGRLRQLVISHLSRMRGKLLVVAFSTVALMVGELLEPWPFKIIFDYVLLGRPLPHALAFLAPLLGWEKGISVLWISLAIVGLALLQAAWSSLRGLNLGS